MDEAQPDSAPPGSGKPNLTPAERMDAPASRRHAPYPAMSVDQQNRLSGDPTVEQSRHRLGEVPPGLLELDVAVESLVE